MNRHAISRALGYLLTVEQVAEVLGVKPQTVYRYRNAADRRPLPEPFATIGRTPVWHREDIERWGRRR